ncbi:MAG: hypothetical protein P8X89_19335 [Reinekea sp.]
MESRIQVLAIRKYVLRHPDNSETKQEWSESTGRVDALSWLLKQGNLQLDVPVVIAPWGEAYRLPVINEK